MISFILFSPGPFWQMKCPIKEMIEYTDDIKKENELILKILLLDSNSNYISFKHSNQTFPLGRLQIYYSTQMLHEKM